jgi:hypothetical protein
MLKIAVALAAVPLALTLAVAGTGVVVVDVEQFGPDGHHIVVPLPLMAVQTAAALAPARSFRMDLGHATGQVELVRGVIRALAEAPDGELVRVEDAHEQVAISKLGGQLRVQVHTDDEDVSVNLPLGLALEALPEDGRVSPAALAAALSGARFTDLVDVRSSREHVKVAVY